MRGWCVRPPSPRLRRGGPGSREPSRAIAFGDGGSRPSGFDPSHGHDLVWRGQRDTVLMHKNLRRQYHAIQNVAGLFYNRGMTEIRSSDTAVRSTAAPDESARAVTRRVLFLSHATPEDSTFAKWLASQLAIAGYEVWCDALQWRPGSKAASFRRPTSAIDPGQLSTSASPRCV